MGDQEREELSVRLSCYSERRQRAGGTKQATVGNSHMVVVQQGPAHRLTETAMFRAERTHYHII